MIWGNQKGQCGLRLSKGVGRMRSRKQLHMAVLLTILGSFLWGPGKVQAETTHYQCGGFSDNFKGSGDGE